MTTEIETFDESLSACKDERIYGICRCCLSAGLHISMLVSFDYLDYKETYIRMLFSCFDLNMLGIEEDNSNEHVFLICDSCITRLRECYSFRCQIVEAQKSFESIVKLENDPDLPLKEGVFKVKNDDAGWISMDFSDVDIKPERPHRKVKKRRKKHVIADLINDENGIKHESDNNSSSGSQENVPLIAFKKKKHKKHRKRLLKKKSQIFEQISTVTVKQKKTTKLQVEKEILSNLDTENLQCKICTKTFLNLFLLRTHINIHYPNHICEVCGKGHATQTRLKNHQRMHIIGSFQCPICGKTFSTKGKYDNHKGKHILPLRHVCPTCPERFANHYQKQKHLETVHKVTLKRYNCESCPLNFTNSGALNNHKIRAHLQKKSHSCSLCSMTFYHKAELGKHMIVHTGERKYLCNICQKSYPRAYTLREHMKIHNNIKKHVCGECGRAFTQKCTLRGHMKVHGMVLTDSSLVKPQ